jgi:translation initiation factor IF-2
MNRELIAFLKARLEEDEHNTVYALQVLGTSAQTVENVIPLLDMVRAVVDLYAEVEHLDMPEGANEGNAFASGQAAGLGIAVKHLAMTYHDHPAFRQEWRPS